MALDQIERIGQRAGFGVEDRQAGASITKVQPGAVMVAVFFTFALSGPLPPKEMGVVLGVAVLLDAFLVRLVLLPVLLRLTGHAAWYVPRWLRRVLPRVTFAHG